MPITPVDIVLFIGLAVAAFTDVRTAVSEDGSLQRGRIPNALTLPLMLLGVGMHAIEGQPLVGLIGLGIAFAVHFPLWTLGVDGAGDAKLMMGVGALWGWGEMLETTWWTFALFIPLGLVLLAARGRLGGLIQAVSWTLAKARGGDPGPRPAPTFWPRAPVILLGAVLARVGEQLDLFAS